MTSLGFLETSYFIIIEMVGDLLVHKDYTESSSLAAFIRDIDSAL